MKVKIEAFVMWHKYEWENEPKYNLSACDMSDCGPEYSLVGKQSFEVEIPDNFDPTPAQIEGLKKKKQEILATAQVQANNIEEQIQRLLCIEHKEDVPL
jgi:hypothetical protein